jgi:predicted alpha/beta hydrolase family esterase
MAETPPQLLVPGWLNSGPKHWQSRWQQERPELGRVDFREWQHPQPQAWTADLRQAVLACPAPPLLIAHSLGCLATANLMALPSPPRIAGVLLVAPPDPGRPDTPAEIAGFSPPARRPFGVPGLVVISSNDPYASETFSLELAHAWGLEVVRLGACGHINDQSGYGEWPEGLVLLERVLERMTRPPIDLGRLSGEPTGQEAS